MNDEIEVEAPKDGGKVYNLLSFPAVEIKMTKHDKFLQDIGTIQNLLLPRVVPHPGGVEILYAINEPSYRAQLEDLLMQKVMGHFKFNTYSQQAEKAVQELLDS